MKIDFNKKVRRAEWNNIHMDFASIGDSALARKAMWVLDRHTGRGRALSVSADYIMTCYHYYVNSGYLEEGMDDSLVQASIQFRICEAIERRFGFSSVDDVFSCLKKRASREIEEHPELHRKNLVFDVDTDPEQREVAQLLNAADARTRVFLVCRFVFAYIAGGNEPAYIEHFADRELHLAVNAFHRSGDNEEDRNLRLFAAALVSTKRSIEDESAEPAGPIIRKNLLDVLEGEI